MLTSRVDSYEQVSYVSCIFAEHYQNSKLETRWILTDEISVPDFEEL